MEPIEEDGSPRVVVQRRKAYGDANSLTSEKHTPEAVAVEPKKFKKAAVKVSLLSKLKKAEKAEKKSQVTEDEEFVPEGRRRFLFDDAAVLKGGTMKDLFRQEEPPEQDFNDVVDQDARRAEVFVSQELVGNLIESVYFRVFIFGLIVVNSLLIGIQTDEAVSEKHRYLFSIFDQIVLATFTFELMLKWYYGFWIFWKNGWNILDFLIIVALLLGPQLAFLSSSRILRILRVLRAFRSLKSVSALAGLSMVVQTSLQSIPDMTNICLLLTIILLMLGVAGVTLFNKPIPKYFGDLQTALFSLFICVTQDGWVEIFNLFKTGNSIELHVGGAAYFFVSIMIGAFVFANLAVAVVVTNLELAIKELKEETSKEVDTLATDKDTIHPPDIRESVPLILFDKFEKDVNFSHQAPLQKATLKSLNAENLENYFVILAALEENIAEYANIKNDLYHMYEVVKDLNTVDVYDEETEHELHFKRAGSGINLDELKKGDILSNLMKLEERDTVTSERAHNITDVIRSARAQTGQETEGRGRKFSASR